MKLAAFLILLLTLPARAGVTLDFFDVGFASGVETADLYVTTSGPVVSAVDYGITASQGATLTGRDVSGSQFGDFYAALPTTDLGASLTTGFGVGPGQYFLARYSFAVDPGITSVVLATYSAPGVGYVGGPPAFADTPFDRQASLSVAVPEPSSLWVGTAVLAGLLNRRRAKR